MTNLDREIETLKPDTSLPRILKVTARCGKWVADCCKTFRKHSKPQVGAWACNQCKKVLRFYLEA